MNPLDWIMKGRFGAAARAGAGFVTVSIVGAIGLVVLAIVMWAASLTPFGLWAALPVIAAAGLVAFALWRQGQTVPDVPRQHPAPLSLSLPGGVGGADGAVPIQTPRVKLIGMPAALVARVHRPIAEAPAIPDADALKRRFDQAFAAGQFDDADRVLKELALLPGQAEWALRKQRLVRQQRARS